jgi:outer membrane protein assembly factor BamB
LVLIFVLVLTSFATRATAENWPQWRGPSLNGVSGETGIPISWSTTENVTWKLELPAWSGSTPIIWEERIFLNVAEDGNLYLWCLDRTDASILWKRFLSDGDRKQQKQNMSSPSPVTDGQHVWIMTGTGILKGFDFAGTEIWARDVQRDYGPFGLNWGYASSPLLHEGALYVQVLHGMKTDDPSYVMRLDKMTGETVWRMERPTDAIRESPDSYTTPALLQYDGKTEIVITGGDCVTGHDPATGEELWRANGLNPEKRRNYRIVASPVVNGDIIYAPTRERPLLALRAGGRGDVTDSHRLWSFDHGPDVPTPVSDGEYFYVVNDRGIMWALDAETGEEIWGQQRVAPGTYSSSPVLVDGKIFVTSEDGVTTVVKAGPEFEILAENSLDDYSLSSPAISQGQIFMRTAGHLYCIGERATP